MARFGSPRPLPFFALTFLISLIFSTANAQVADGELVRVRTVDGSKVLGTVSEVTSTGVSLTFPSGGSQNISYGDMESFHRSIGRRTYRKRGALIGAGAGVLLGISVGIAFGETCDDTFDDFGDFDDTCESFGFLAGVYSSIYYGAGGALVGVIAGTFIKGERWQQISIPGMGSASFEPRIGVRANGSPILGVKMVF